MWDYAHYTFMAVYLAFSIPMMAVFVARRHQEPIKSRAWDLALTSAVYGAFMVVCMAIAAELNIANDATPCNLVIWPFAPFTCFFLNPYFVRGAILQFNHRWNLEKLQQCKDERSQRRLDWFQKNKNKVAKKRNWAWVWANAIVYILVAVMYEFINTADPLPGQWLPFNECLAKTRYMVLVLAGCGTLIIVAYYLTFFDLSDAFYFKKELLAVMIILPTCFALWGVSVFGEGSDLFVAQSTVPIYIVVATTFCVSIVLPVVLSIRQSNMVTRLKILGADLSDSEDNNNGPAPLAIIEDNPTTWSPKGSLRSNPAFDSTTAAAIAAGILRPTSPLAAAAAVPPSTAAPGLAMAATSGDMVSTSTAALLPAGETGEHDSSKSSSKRRAQVMFRNQARGPVGPTATVIPPRTPTSRLFSITLVNDRLRAAFQRYCMESWCIENYLFYRDAVKFRTMNAIFMNIEAVRMADIYLPTESTLAVNLPDDIRSRILARIQAKEISNDLYEEAEHSVLEFMRNDTFLKWRITDSFTAAWREANIPAAMLLPGKPMSALSDENVTRLVVELGTASQATAKHITHAMAVHDAAPPPPGLSAMPVQPAPAVIPETAAAAVAATSKDAADAPTTLSGHATEASAPPTVGAPPGRDASVNGDVAVGEA